MLVLTLPKPLPTGTPLHHRRAMLRGVGLTFRPHYRWQSRRRECGRSYPWSVLTLTLFQDAIPCGASAAALPYQAESAWLFGPGIFPLSCSISDGTAMRQNAPGFNFTGNFSTMS
jgi:hypothetical protein